MAKRLASLPNLVLFPLCFAAVALSRTSRFSDSPTSGTKPSYYIPAALDFYHHGLAHPALHQRASAATERSSRHALAHHRIQDPLHSSAGLCLRRHRPARSLPSCAESPRPHRRNRSRYSHCLLSHLVRAVHTCSHADIFSAAFTLCAFAVYFRTLDLNCHPECNEGPASFVSSRSSHPPRHSLHPRRALLKKPQSSSRRNSCRALSSTTFVRKRPASWQCLTALSFPVASVSCVVRLAPLPVPASPLEMPGISPLQRHRQLPPSRTSSHRFTYRGIHLALRSATSGCPSSSLSPACSCLDALNL